MKENLWIQHATALADAYVRRVSTGPVRFELVTRALLMHMPPDSRIVDVGGGFGLQAIMLARQGHSVVIIDLDPQMLAIARDKLLSESLEVSSRVQLVLGSGEEAASLVGTNFDVACCHSVLMYLTDPAPMLSGLVSLVREGGFVSVLCVNKESYAMRSGLQGHWREAAAILEGRQMAGRFRDQTREEVTEILEAAGAKIREWYGIGVFTDHFTENIIAEDPEEVYQAEWLASRQDPYRQVAHCFHILAERTR